MRDEDGNILITVVLVSLVIGALASLALANGRQAEWSSSSDRNREQALGVAEAGIHKVVERISAQLATPPSSGPDFWGMTDGQSLPTGCSAGGTCTAAKNDTNYSGTTPQGRYWFWVNRTSQGFVIDGQSTAGGTTLGRGRHIEVSLIPPSRFRQNKAYALFSNTNITIENNDQILDGDVYANGSIDIFNSNKNPTLRGSLTSQSGYINLGGSVVITGNAWSGGFYCDRDSGGACVTGGTRWAMSLDQNSGIGGWARASTTTPTDPACPGNTNFNVLTANGSTIGGSLTTPGVKTGPGSVAGAYNPNTCTSAPPPETFPTYQFNPTIYDQSTYHEFSSVSAFQAWLNDNLDNFHGTFLVHQTSPTQTGRIDLSRATLTGSTTLVSDAPIYTGDLSDSLVTDPNAVFVLVSNYAPPGTGAVCSTVDDRSDCAIHIKNQFTLNSDGSCKIATLVHAEYGPVAIKNGSSGGANGTLCGSVEAQNILVKNNETVAYDSRITRVVGFGLESFEISKWKELPSR